MNEWKLSGAGRIVLAFVAGTLFALLPAYYFYVGREAAIRDLPQAGHSGSPTLPQPSSVGGPNAASRMTYELSRVPAERAAPQAKAPAAELASQPKSPGGGSVIASPHPKPPAATIASPQPQPPAAEPKIASRPSSEPAKAAQQSVSRIAPDDAPASRIANARPISATPPDPRDTTRAIEKEARLERREPGASLAGVKPDGTQPRYIEGRDLVLPPKATVAMRSGTAMRSATESPSATDTEIESRLAATRSWLSGAAPTTHTIQILGTSNEDQLKAHLKTLGKLLEPGQLYVFRTIAQGKPSMTVVYGAYADRQAALQALQKLPESVTANRPVLRTVKGIRAETAQHKTDS